jgi:hypothetical protein
MSGVPTIPVEVTHSRLKVPPSSSEGFPIILDSSLPQTILFLGGWHDHFEDWEKVVHILQKAIAGEIRIEETSRCGIAYRWAIQELDLAGIWQTRFITELLIPIPLPGKRTRHLVNRYAPAA